MTTRRLTLSTVLAVFAFAAPTFALAADKELLDILLANGAINQSQYNELIKKDALDKEDVDEVVVKLDRKGFNIASSDGEYAIKIGTRLHAEASTHQGDLPQGIDPTNGTELRRARIETKGKFAKRWSWAAEVDFADNRTSIKDFWLGYTTEDGTKFYFGHQKQPFNLGLEMSSNDLPFIERPVDNFLVSPFVDRAIGFRAEKSGDNWFAAGGIFGESVSPNANVGDEGWGVAGRFVFTPIRESDQVLHLGVRAAMRAPNNGSDAVRIRDETTHLSSLRIVDTGTIADVDSTNLYGFEAGYAVGPFSVVGEYSMVSNDVNGGGNLDFDGWNVYGTYSLTGESRAAGYKMSSGEFKRLIPAREFNPAEGTWGAWELALRFASINLNDGAFVGGDESVLTSGLNWYPNTNMRFMLEWSRILDTDGSTPLRQAADGLNIFQFRTQYTF